MPDVDYHNLFADFVELNVHFGYVVYQGCTMRDLCLFDKTSRSVEFYYDVGKVEALNYGHCGVELESLERRLTLFKNVLP